MFPGEIMLSLLKSKTMETNPVGRREVTCPSPKGMYGGAPECADFGLQMNRRSGETHQLWARRTEKLIPILLTNRRGDPVKVRLANATDKGTWYAGLTDFIVGVPHGDLPRGISYVNLTSQRYKD
ncbi:hypothetical protein PC116_g17948 [Phytophthora cactorum]|nr:hypothetical protein PC117_g18736 [Phytophthora cactorum]KAG3022243.1 hypothetical protein PC119_g9359 [Phytophthora cactorum]KAG3132392.1 hypothetical protein PC128_g26479 [Phytophthora cactorum]KAG4050582.1 hypothetical protein PC123_g14179 [Phytophthora cactorum]KAG4233874.1 hypothetical protein PC116_g17948 [Phytophthora cactorum]